MSGNFNVSHSRSRITPHERLAWRFRSASALAPRHRTTHVTCATASSSTPALFGLPLFPLRSCLHPTIEGQVHVFEKRYLQLFQDIQDNGAGGAPLRFGHIMARDAAPPALMEDTMGGLPRVGCVAEIQEIMQRTDGTVFVRYKGLRRFKTVSMWQDEPYQVACCVWYDDEAGATSDSEAGLHALEADLYHALRKVASLTKAVSAKDDAPLGLPDVVLRYAPPPQVEKTVATYLKQAGHPAGSRIATYLRHGSVYGSTQSGLRKSQDPYQMMREAVGGGHRRELFSFAAASMVEMGLPERLALLQSRDTAARLQWVLGRRAPDPAAAADTRRHGESRQGSRTRHSVSLGCSSHRKASASGLAQDVKHFGRAGIRGAR